MAQFASNDDLSFPAPRPVSRGANFQTGFLGIDSLYLVVEYPSLDLFNFWSSFVPNLHDRRLYEGILVDEFLIKKGGNGYKLSVWDGDTRLFITDDVDEKHQQTGSTQPGMGVMLQLSPKWLRRWGDIVQAQTLINNAYAQLAVFGVRNPRLYPVRLNRIDLTLDALGLAVDDFSVDEWRDQWVGRAQQKHFYDSARTGKLEGLAIGTSSGVIRFKVYDKVAEAISRRTLAFWRSVWGVGADEPINVARFEWSIRAYEGKFTDFRYLPDLTFEKFLDLLNYVTLKWGRLCLPQSNSNSTRRELAPLWVELRRLIEEWSIHYEGFARREYHFKPDLNPAYVRAAAGWIAGLMARVGIEDDLAHQGSLSAALDTIAEHDISLLRKAEERWAVLSRLHNLRGIE